MDYNNMRELKVNELSVVTGGEWEDITCTAGTDGVNCTGSAGDIADGVRKVVKKLNDVGSALGSWLYDKLN